MNQKLKAKWVAALRSGEYMQGAGRLKIVDGTRVTHCCLGVLCEVMGVKIEMRSSYSHLSESTHQRLDDFMTRNPQHATKSLPHDPLSYPQENQLTRMNDGSSTTTPVRKHSFLEIADWIEENL